MNILLITHEKNINGASKALLTMADHLLAEKHKIFVLTPFSSGDMVDELGKLGIMTISFGFHRWIENFGNGFFKSRIKRFFCFLKLIYDYLYINKIIKELEIHKIDIVHTNTSVICIGAWISKKMNIPHIWHLREFGMEDFNMTPVLSEKFTWNYMNCNADLFIAISKAINDKYIHLIDNSKIRIIYDGVKKVKRNQKSEVSKDSSINILLVGRLSETKGHLDAIRALKKLQESTKREYFLYLAGNGDQDFIRTDSAFNSVKSQIIFCGYVQDMNKLRENIHLELMCSKSEGFGLVTVEAMMFGHPVIGTNAGGTKEIIKEGWNGYLYSRGNYKELADKIILASDENKYEILSNNAKKFAELKFNDEENIRDIINIYNEIYSKYNSCLKGSI